MIGKLYVDRLVENQETSLSRFRLVTTEWIAQQNVEFLSYYFTYRNNLDNDDQNNQEYILTQPSSRNAAIVNLPKGNFPNDTIEIIVYAGIFILYR